MLLDHPLESTSSWFLVARPEKKEPDLFHNNGIHCQLINN